MLIAGQPSPSVDDVGYWLTSTLFADDGRGFVPVCLVVKMTLLRYIFFHMRRMKSGSSRDVCLRFMSSTSSWRSRFASPAVNGSNACRSSKNVTRPWRAISRKRSRNSPCALVYTAVCCGSIARASFRVASCFPSGSERRGLSLIKSNLIEITDWLKKCDFGWKRVNSTIKRSTERRQMAAATTEDAGALQKLQEEIQQIHEKVASLDKGVSDELETESGMSYLQVKNHALLTYTKMELFFAVLKLQAPDKVKDHPVFKELVRYRTLIERIRPLDRKMAYQVDKMLKVAISGGENLDESLQYAPNPDQLAGQDGQDDDEEEESGTSGAKDGIYRAPRLAAVHYEEEEREEIKKAKREERNRKRLQKSAILSELREEFSERPTEILASGSSALDKEIAKDEAEKREFEESRFVRVVTSRKDKIRKRQRESEAMRAEDMGSIDNFAAVQDILSLDKSKHRIPTASFGQTKSASNGKTGGIFAHVEVPTEKKRKVGRGNGQPPQVSRTATTAPFGGGKATPPSTESTNKPGGGKKKKVVFSSIF